jgi:hypothetical protein
MLADRLLAAQEDGAKEVLVEGDLSGNVQVHPTGLQGGLPLEGYTPF